MDSSSLTLPSGIRGLDEVLGGGFHRSGIYLIMGRPGAGKTVCIDFSSPNIAKELAYHHIRSTMIGNALVRIHRHLGWNVVGINCITPRAPT